jgi:ABC-type Fe3+ transport system permease subunit
VDYLIKIGWFLSETCLAIGMIGTVAGFLLMLGSAFSGIDVADTATLQSALTSMATGMSTALYTTLVGLVCGLYIKSQLVNLEHLLDQKKSDARN